RRRSGRGNRRHDRRRRPVRRRIPRRAVPRARPRGLPPGRRGVRRRDYLALRGALGKGPQDRGETVKHIKRLAVYCGSAPGSQPEFAGLTRATAKAMVERDVELVYGGGRLGLMGIIADSVLELGGKAYGVIPQLL